MGFTDEAEVEEETETGSDEIDLDQLAPSAQSINDIDDDDRIFRILCWGPPGMGKSTMGFSFPEPVCVIDTENKAADLKKKFSGKNIFIWTPDGFDDAVQARDEALNLLEEYEAQTDEKGTVVVDSMSDMWEWSQYKYIEDWYPNTPPDEVNLSLQDWPKIKDYHNKKFRRGIKDCDFHVCWTATRKDAIGKKMEQDLDKTPSKPGGETNNDYKVNSIIRLRHNDNGIPVGDLQKSGKVRFKYLGLERPTFDKHKEIIEHVEEIEAGGADSLEEVVGEYDLDYQVSFTEANTMRFRQDE